MGSVCQYLSKDYDVTGMQTEAAGMDSASADVGDDRVEHTDVAETGILSVLVVLSF